jgi:AraC-like DNA-binding protein
MKYKEILPGERLRPYIKCYFLLESEENIAFADTLFPAGHIEIVFNLGEALWQSAIDTVFQTDPPIELLGQITRPLSIKTKGECTMLGIRFFPHSAACFLKEELGKLNNQISDLRDVLGSSVRTVHAKLLEEPNLAKRIELIESFLLNRLSLTFRKADKLTLIGQILKEMQRNDSYDTIKTIASRYNISPRYLQKLFVQYVGVTPKVYSQINRFQLSLKHITKKCGSLTSAAYNCGYADQSHFIREFKSFAGMTPSAYLLEYSPVNQAFPK